MDYTQNSNIRSSHIFTWQTKMAKKEFEIATLTNFQTILRISSQINERHTHSF
jgi:hypothetical protein